MLFYRFSRDPEEAEAHWVYAPTLTAIRPVAKSLHNAAFSPVVEEVEISTDKRSMTTLLNGADPEVTVRRAWDLTPRGALKLMPPDVFKDYMGATYF